MYALRVPVAMAVTAWLAASSTARAQDQFDNTPPPHIAVVDGAATLDREGQTQPATPGMPFVPGDRLHTERGRVEILFPDGSVLDVDEVSSVDLQDAGLLRMISGRVLMSVARARGASASRYQIDTPSASASIDGPGDYRVAVINGSAGPQTEFAVLRGSGTLTTESGSQPLRAGERSLAWVNGVPSYPQPFNSARIDAFERWTSAQRELRLGSVASAQYLPPDLQMYGGVFDRNGSWAAEAPYGNVWYPSVPFGWRPYYDGYWDPVPRFGWTWIGGVNAWSWPTHHYGRWGYARSRWFWIPGRQWAPAWVHWGAAPGYVGWCPLGFDNRPVFSLSVSYTDPWPNGWVVLPRPYFGARGSYVHRHAVSPRMLPVNTPFVEHAAPPILPRAVARGSAGAAFASRSYAVPRPSTGAADNLAARPSPPRSTFERRYGVAALPPAAQSNRSNAPQRDDRAYNRRPPAAAGGAFGPPQAQALPRVVMPAPAQGAPLPRRPSFGATAPADTPTPGRLGPVPRYAAPRIERTRPSPPAAAPQEYRGRAVPRSSTLSPPPAFGHAAPSAQGQAPSRGDNSGGSGGSAQRSHDPHSRRPR